MQISRHWRLNPQRYRLEGFRNNNGEFSLQARPALNTSADVEPTPNAQPAAMRTMTKVASPAA